MNKIRLALRMFLGKNLNIIIPHNHVVGMEYGYINTESLAYTKSYSDILIVCSTFEKIYSKTQ